MWSRALRVTRTRCLRSYTLFPRQLGPVLPSAVPPVYSGRALRVTARTGPSDTSLALSRHRTRGTLPSPARCAPMRRSSHRPCPPCSQCLTPPCSHRPYPLQGIGDPARSLPPLSLSPSLPLHTPILLSLARDRGPTRRGQVLTPALSLAYARRVYSDPLSTALVSASRALVSVFTALNNMFTALVSMSTACVSVSTALVSVSTELHSASTALVSVYSASTALVSPHRGTHVRRGRTSRRLRRAAPSGG
jgi:hypothetical protein